ncbi:urea carboxylase [Microbacterium endophyticum]|uniref:Urea carboxylase n=1 Tax=Microbacterium endophyticum TaxID=1526412 RepID=A0A7W4V207_9MICO|nr:urea carboxylase [Microbacterium endophyticum]MBB2975387.1 urea carboxylase [Microbacterium endophyticum]NIK35594.1 urea carboxylase [Microbacterium endophyticum]
MTGFDTVLVANRGEIARRIIRSVQAQGLRAIAVYSDADRAAPHVREADEAVRIGPPAASESYLLIDAIIAAAQKTGAGAIHPGYGFLAESAPAARAVAAAGLKWLGPTPEQIETFGLKHTARELAEAAGVPLLPGSGVLDDVAHAEREASRIGYPVMLKATGGGGGIGMQVCADAAALRSAFDTVSRQAAASFGAAGIFLEKLVRPARHIEVQIFGDGEGRIAVFGDRDCTLQRRNQKVMEEAPAPHLPDEVRRHIHAAARRLAESINYRSAGTVEFVYDPSSEQAFFLEVNTRLQVEHPVTEAVFGIDLVALMVTLAREGAEAIPSHLFSTTLSPNGHAVEARIYAEDPDRGHTPSTGLITAVRFPGENSDPMPGVRIDGWIENGTEVTASYDPLLAKVITFAPDRDAAFDLMHEAISASRIDGIATGLGLLRELSIDPRVRAMTHDTTMLADVHDPDDRVDVLAPGIMTTVQDLPGRLGYWDVGVPPSGPMDALSFREANRAVGNLDDAPGLEITLQGPTLRFSTAAVVCVAGAEAPVTLDGAPVALWEPIEIPAGGMLAIGQAPGPGIRLALAVRGGIDVPSYLGSASTFTLGGFGGHGGRALVAGDVLRVRSNADLAAPAATPIADRPHFTTTWRIGVTEGPHAAPEFFTREDIDTLYATDYGVQINSARTGVRLTGPRPQWARVDGGEAGLHPSNIHDTPYAVGALDFTGDTPIILGPDGPSLGGFVCPAVVASGELWKVGQLRPGDTVRFVPVREADAASLDAERSLTGPSLIGGDGDDGVMGRIEAITEGDRVLRPDVTYRRDGDDNLLVEYGDNVLDLGLRMRVHALQTRLAEVAPGGIVDVTPGIRSLQIHTDAHQLRASQLVGMLREIEEDLPPTSELVVPSRTVNLPLSWDDPATRLAIERYMAGVRNDAPWTPWNIEFIRRINGLDTVEDVQRTVFDAEYLVLGLGDVYLGAPVATPLDPRHRLVTTKYNPARTWTAENSVGIGGAYMCIYGMEGPGGYQFVGRTVQIWNRFRQGGMFAENPWALRFFDRINWYPVSAEELLDLRADTDAGRANFETREGTFALGDYEKFLAANSTDIEKFRERQRTAFDEERERWRAAGEFDRTNDEPVAAASVDTIVVPPGATAVTAPFAATVWKVDQQEGAQVTAGDGVIVLEAMKMETTVSAPASGPVTAVYVRSGEQVSAGQVLAVIGGAQ